MVETLHKIAAKAVLVDPVANRALIMRLNAQERERKGRDEWHLPGGAQDNPAEPLTDVVAREIREESGIATIKIIAEIGREAWNAYYDGHPAYIEATFFEAEVAGEVPELMLSEEHEEAAWVSSADLDAYPGLTPEARKYIGEVLSRRGQAA